MRRAQAAQGTHAGRTRTHTGRTLDRARAVSALPARAPCPRPPPRAQDGAAWIGSPTQKQHHYSFTIPDGETVRRATAFVDAPGCAVVYANGANVNGLAGICPWTQTQKTVLFSAYNMTGFLVPGANALGFQLGQSMYVAREGGTPSLRFKMVVVYASGKKEVHISKGVAPPPPPPPTPPPPAPTAECGEAPEHTTLEMSCPRGQTITAVDFAAFGTPTGACTGAGGGKPANNANTFKPDPACDAAAAHGAAAALCLGKQRCTLAPACETRVCRLAPPGSGGTFPDPCRMVKKHLSVAVTCGAGRASVGSVQRSRGSTPRNGSALAVSVSVSVSGSVSGSGWLAAAGPVVCDDPWKGTTTDWGVASGDDNANWTTAAFDPAASNQTWSASTTAAVPAAAGAVHRTSTAPPTRERVS